MKCDAIAPYYEMVEHLSFGKRLEHSRYAFLNEIKTAENALVCGGGDGRFLAHLLRVNPSVKVDFVDLSPAMIARAKARIASTDRSAFPRVNFYEGDLRNFSPRRGAYDLVVTNFFLDCFSDAEVVEIVAQLTAWATPDAEWLVSDFQETTGPLSRLCSKGIIRGLYAAFRITTGLRVTRLPDFAAALASAGFQRDSEESIAGGLLHSSLWRRAPRPELAKAPRPRP
jgi:ubiquinone/menaquinone biosynthesis C-methylase UbiE